MHTVVETPVFISSAKDAGVTEEELDDIRSFLAANPEAGALMAGTGGARKFRWAGKGRGKSGGYRVITFFSGMDIPVFLLDIYTKDEKDNLSQAERNQLKKILGAMIEIYKGKRK